MGPWPLPDPGLVLEDRAVRLVPLDVGRDGEALWQAADPRNNGEDLFRWSLGTGPFADRQDFLDHLVSQSSRSSAVTYTVVSLRLGRPVGGLSLLNLRPDHGCLEVGSIWYAKEAQRTEVNTHALFLVLGYAFDRLGCRRVEWKCHHDNLPSRAAALRLGFRFEGTFRQHFWDKGANRDTDWFSIVDPEWPAVRERFESFLLTGLPVHDRQRPTAERTYLPLFWDMTGKGVLIIGGGKAAWQKVKALAPFGVSVTVVSPAFHPDLAARAAEPGSLVELVHKSWQGKDLSGVADPAVVGLVLACTDDLTVNDAVAAAARARGIPVLDAARPARGDFIQPAARKTRTYTLAVSSGGTGPGGAVAVRDALTGAFDAMIWALGSGR